MKKKEENDSFDIALMAAEVGMPESKVRLSLGLPMNFQTDGAVKTLEAAKNAAKLSPPDSEELIAYLLLWDSLALAEAENYDGNDLFWIMENTPSQAWLKSRKKAFQKWHNVRMEMIDKEDSVAGLMAIGQVAPKETKVAYAAFSKALAIAKEEAEYMVLIMMSPYSSIDRKAEKKLDQLLLGKIEEVGEDAWAIGAIYHQAPENGKAIMAAARKLVEINDPTALFNFFDKKDNRSARKLIANALKTSYDIAMASGQRDDLVSAVNIANGLGLKKKAAVAFKKLAGLYGYKA
jgi:predicted peroxiredoxin